MDCTAGLLRKPWDLPFVAEPEEVSGLRRTLRSHLDLWGLSEVADAAQLCVSELVSNVITHVGPGTPARLAVSMNGAYLRIEVHDPDTRALPTLLDATSESEAGRGMALVDAIADRWGVLLLEDRKVTWCELGAEFSSRNGKCEGAQESGVEAAVDVIANLLHWLWVRGCDVDDALNRAHTLFAAEVTEAEALLVDQIP